MEPPIGTPAGIPPSFGASAAPESVPASTPAPAPEPVPAANPPIAASQPSDSTPPLPQSPFQSPFTVVLPQAPEPEPTVGWYASAGPYAAAGANPRRGLGATKGTASRLPGWGSRSPRWSNWSNRSRLVNATLFGVAPLALAGIVAAAFVLASPGKGQASSHAGFQAAAGPSAAAQPQGSGSTSPGMPSPSKSNLNKNPGKRSTMPDGKPRPDQSATGNSGHGSGSTSKSQPAKKKKSKSAAGGGRVTPANLGVPNFDGYCGHIGRGSAVTTANTAYGWACSLNPSLPMAIQSACAWTYGQPLSKIINVSANYHDPNAWQCWRTNGILGQLDIATYCTAAGLGAAKLSTADAYGWTCGSQPIDTNAACQLVYHNGNAFSRFAVFQDPYSWQCWD